MKTMLLKLTPPILLLCLWIGFCAYLSNYRCCNANIDLSLMSSKTYPLTVQDKNTLIARCGTDFQFVLHEAETNMNSELERLIDKTAVFLQNHPTRRLVLTGCYGAEEKVRNTRLGLERADWVKQKLLLLGIPAIQLKTRQNIKEPLHLTDNKVTKAVLFSFENMPAQDQLLEEIKANLQEQKVVLYFEPSQQRLKLTPTQKHFFEQLNSFLIAYPKQKIKITGYTDNQGGTRQNIRLGRERARFVKNFLLGEGFDDDDIVASSEGENNPVSSNETDEGRAKNRRVEIELINAS